MDKIDKIINEEINRTLMTESALSDIKNLLKKFVKDKSLSKDERKEKKKLKKKAEKAKKGSKKLRRRSNGGKEYYDYNDYNRKHVKMAKGDADSIRDTIDQENTNIASVARSVFSDHDTDEGAQSHLRKVLNGERPMTQDVASKLERLISRGKIAVK